MRRHSGEWVYRRPLRTALRMAAYCLAAVWSGTVAGEIPGSVEAHPVATATGSIPGSEVTNPAADKTENKAPAHIKLAFYNTENFYDTVPNPLTGDEDYTPQGARRWDTERYNDKTGRIARVLDALDADLVGLAEVENEQVVRDLMFATKQNYSYVHRHTNDLRGMDQVLLYRGSRFFPQRVRQAGYGAVRREFLVVDGELLGEPVTVVVCHMPSMMNSASRRTAAAEALHKVTDSLAGVRPARKVIVMGDFNTTPRSPLTRRVAGEALFTPFAELEREGYGSYAYRDRRFLYDFILLSGNLSSGQGLHYGGDCGIFVREEMLHRSGPKKGYPLRTFEGAVYQQGYSDHLPVWLRLEQKNPPKSPGSNNTDSGNSSGNNTP